MPEKKTCAVCPDPAQWATRVQPEYGRYEDGPEYCGRHLAMNITQLSAEYLTVVVGAVLPPPEDAEYCVDLTVRWQGRAPSPTDAWRKARGYLMFCLVSARCTVLSDGYEPSQVHETLTSRRQRHG